MYSFAFQAIDVNFIFKMLNQLSTKSNLDILSMDSRLLRAGANAIAPYLCSIFNISLSSGELPLEWKSAKVTPIYKGNVATTVPYLSLAILPK